MEKPTDRTVRRVAAFGMGLTYLFLGLLSIGTIIAFTKGEWRNGFVSLALVVGFSVIWVGPRMYTRSMERQAKGSSSGHD